jgi:serine/threonine protein kinase
MRRGVCTSAATTTQRRSPASNLFFTANGPEQRQRHPLVADNVNPYTDSRNLYNSYDRYGNSNYYSANIQKHCGSMTQAPANSGQPLPKFAFTEITLSRMVGQGGFSVVREITSIALNDIYDTSDKETKSREAFANIANQHGLLEGGKYVLKSLRTDLPDEEYQKGIEDLAIEADFLSVLSHTNIIAMRAVANSDPHEPRFFVVLDKLSYTLERKFNYWRKVVGENVGYWLPCWGYCCAKAPALHSVWKERLRVLLDMASAMQYLHAQGIVYRDLKPDNIGFDNDGVMKLFDFGLAKRLNDVEQVEGGAYKLTGNTGSLRYMAPEVANDLPYDQTVDAYSFGILFWQTCSLTTPYAGYSQKMHAEKVVRLGQRPIPDQTWPASWVQLMQDCWSAESSVRPSFDVIVQMLRDRLEELQHDDGVVPTRTSEIRAKKRKKKVSPQNHRLDVDTRLSTENDTSVRNNASELV